MSREVLLEDVISIYRRRFYRAVSLGIQEPYFTNEEICRADPLHDDYLLGRLLLCDDGPFCIHPSRDANNIPFV